MQNQRPKPASWVSSTDPAQSKFYVFLYDADFSIAGFAFERNGDIVRPVDSFTLDNSQPDALTAALDKINEQSPIELVIVPPMPSVPDGEAMPTNYLLQSIPAKYKKQTNQARPSFAQCVAARNIAIQKGNFLEDGYFEVEKIKASLQRADDKNPPSAWLWAYCYGCAVVTSFRAVKASDYWAPNNMRRRY